MRKWKGGREWGRREGEGVCTEGEGVCTEGDGVQRAASPWLAWYRQGIVPEQQTKRGMQVNFAILFHAPNGRWHKQRAHPPFGVPNRKRACALDPRLRPPPPRP